MKDIETRADIELLMQTFYSKALTDEAIGYFFTEVVPLNMEVHMPLIVDFWETVLLGKTAYRGNVMQVHQHIHSLSAFKEAHFAQWVFLLHQTVDELYSGDHAELAKQRAESIATLMRIKLLHSGINHTY
ncbi:MAG: group III truncated hemoglobin [Bacteroidota bacterium]